MRLKYLITGCGRSGTVYMARLLTSVGIPCGHEAIFDQYGLDYARKRLSGELPIQTSWVSRSVEKNGRRIEGEQWLYGEVQAESSYMAAPFLGSDILTDTKIIHVIRDPVKVVNSFCNYLNYFGKGANDYESFIYEYLPRLKESMPQYDRAALYWIRWNEMVAADLVHRVEDGPQEVLGFLGVIGPCYNDETANTFRKSSERFAVSKIESDVIRDEFVAVGRRYGYPMASEYLLI